MIDPESQRLCFAEILICGAAGMAIGAALIDPSDIPAGSEVSSVTTARYYGDRPQSVSSLPRLPLGIFVAMLSSLAPLLSDGCSGFISEHLLFFAGVIISALSTGGWLFIASGLQRGINNQRRARIEGFIADSTAPVPVRVPGLDEYFWLKTWNWANIVCFILLTVVLIRSMVLLPTASWPWNS
ncbi:MAG TPA: hypothetical protein VGG46_17880 [Terriglobales bacterium]|jgi:hypothetical protein